MIIKLSPFLMDGVLAVSVAGDVVTVCGEAVDLSVIPDGFRLPSEAIDSPWFSPASFIERVNGELSFTLSLPITPRSPVAMRFPEDIKVRRDGVVDLPSEVKGFSIHD